MEHLEKTFSDWTNFCRVEEKNITQTKLDDLRETNRDLLSVFIPKHDATTLEALIFRHYISANYCEYMARIDDLRQSFQKNKDNLWKLFTVEQLATLPAPILLKNHFVEKIKKELRTAMEEDEQGEKPKNGDSMYTCPHCNKRNTKLIEKQIRRADEPASEFVVCYECLRTTRLS